MSRARRITLLAVAVLALLTVGLLLALPEIVRRVALAEIPKRTGRAVAIQDVDLNLFTGRLAVTGFRLAEREGPEPFVAFDRLVLRLSPLALLRSHVRIRELTLTAPGVRVVRTGPAEFNFSDLGGRQPAPPPPEPADAEDRWTVTVEALRVAEGQMVVDDRAVTPPTVWRVAAIDVEATGVGTAPGAAPGRLGIRAQVDDARLSVDADPLGLDPLRLRVTASLEGFDTGRLDAYVYGPLETPYRPKGGRFTVKLTGDVDSDAEGLLRKALVTGTMALDGEAFVMEGRADPFIGAKRLAVEVDEVDLLARTLRIGTIALDGLDLAVRRDARGAIDLVELFQRKSPASAPAPAPPPGSAEAPGPTARPRTMFPVIRALGQGFQEIRVERIRLAADRVIFTDEATAPRTVLPLTNLKAAMDAFTWPVRGPATMSLSTGLPGGGRLEAAGPVTVTPLDATFTLSIRDAPVAPYQGYIPIPAQLSGRYSGDSRNRIALRDGRLVARSTGRSWARDVELREPGAARPAIRVERMELAGIDFDWPRRAAAATVTFQRPRVEIERDADGTFNLRRLFAAPAGDGPPQGSPPAPPPASKEAKGSSLDPMQLDFGTVRLEEGFIRFLDRTTRPAFSQDLSQLAVTLSGYGNRPDRRAKLTLRSLVGGDGALDIRGEIGALSAPPFFDLVGELRDFKLPSVGPYTVANIGWAVKQGALQYRVRFKLDGDQLIADNDLVVGGLQVAPAGASDEVKRRIGMPLGLIVALIKDQKGEIRAHVPVEGRLNDPQVSLRETIWTAVKNVLVNIATAPFKAIGRLFGKGGDAEAPATPTVDPVTFAAGSSVLSPAMEDHLLRVGDFLRQAPFVNLSLAAVPGAGDAAALRDEAVTARLEAFGREHGLEGDAVLPAYFAAHLPDVPLPATVEEQRAVLRDREPAPDARLADLARRRLEVTREHLVTAEGIPESRLITPDAGATAAAPPAAPADAEAPAGGRVEFGVVAGG